MYLKNTVYNKYTITPSCLNYLDYRIKLREQND